MNDTQVAIRIPDALLAQLDAWCSSQTLKPSRSQAIRSFVERGLNPPPADAATQQALDYIMRGGDPKNVP